MNLERLNERSACEIKREIAMGRATAEAVVGACLERIRERDPELGAWAAVDEELVRSEAREADPRGSLFGIPVGVKDVIDTAGLPTGMGSPIYDGFRPAKDAACVAQWRAASGIVLGKTVTCEFAGPQPANTRNPHNAAHTPGGSSSGSAAAVADYMVPVAFGTQTRGSVIRPASYCGVVGFNPSYGIISRDGLKFAAESLDTIGLFARDVDDIALAFSTYTGRDVAEVQTSYSAPKVAICLYGFEHAQKESAEAVEDAAARLERAGATLSEFTFTYAFDALTEACVTVNNVERARATAWEWNNHPDKLSDRLRRAIEQGLNTPLQDYLSALRLFEQARLSFDGLLGDIDIILTASASGEAPTGLDFTGDPRLQGIWTALHVPTISLPTYKGPNDLPVGIQLVGRKYSDEALLNHAAWAFSILGKA
jgi:Asp-tRNA(Asn)/Glu-tRNA(Gln) amidotransferase A subunit family amidase